MATTQDQIQCTNCGRRVASEQAVRRENQTLCQDCANKNQQKQQ